jgi:hypothetical protein
MVDSIRHRYTLKLIQEAVPVLRRAKPFYLWVDLQKVRLDLPRPICIPSL